jgi:hypothetical protein
LIERWREGSVHVIRRYYGVPDVGARAEDRRRTLTPHVAAGYASVSRVFSRIR